MTPSAKPAGHFAAPLIIFGFVSLLLGVATEVMGTFSHLTEGLRGWWSGKRIPIEAEMGLPGPVGVLITAAAVFGLVAAVLSTPGMARQVILGITALFLAIMLFPAFAAWGVFWNPFGTILAVIWAWASGVVYAKGHRMPCEGELEEKPVAKREGEPKLEEDGAS